MFGVNNLGRNNFCERDAVTAKIIDPGLAKVVNETDSEATISIVGGFAGTPEFASPEQFAGVGVDIRSDLYSLGPEPLQYPSGPQEGRLRESSLQTFLPKLATFNRGLCIVTTRLPVNDIANHESGSV